MQQVHATFMPSDLLKDLEGLRSQAGKTYPELQHLDLDGSNDVYPPDVEQEANEWFQKVYHDKLNIEDFVSMLKGWQVQPFHTQVWDSALAVFHASYCLQGCTIHSNIQSYSIAYVQACCIDHNPKTFPRLSVSAQNGIASCCCSSCACMAIRVLL